MAPGEHGRGGAHSPHPGAGADARGRSVARASRRRRASRAAVGTSWIAAPTAAFLYQFREWCVHSAGRGWRASTSLAVRPRGHRRGGSTRDRMPESCRSRSILASTSPPARHGPWNIALRLRFGWHIDVVAHQILIKHWNGEGNVAVRRAVDHPFTDDLRTSRT